MRRTIAAMALLAFALAAAPAAAPIAHAQTGSEAPSRAQARAELERIEDESARAAEEGRTLADWFKLGGWVMYVLVFCSVLVVFLVLERLVRLRKSAVIPRKFLQQVMEHWNKREVDRVVALCGSTDASIARVLRSGLIHYEEGLGRVEEAIAAAGDHEATQLRRNLPVLSAIGNIATMLGLLGTVLGMIESFDLIAKTGTGDARVVAGGIFTALVTTASGLMVGIPAVACHAFLRRKVEALEIELEETSFRLIEALSVQSPGPSAPPAHAAGELATQEA